MKLSTSQWVLFWVFLCGLAGFAGIYTGKHDLLGRDQKDLEQWHCKQCQNIPTYEKNLEKAEVAYNDYRQLDASCKRSVTIMRAEDHAELALSSAQWNLKRGKEDCAQAKNCD